MGDGGGEGGDNTDMMMGGVDMNDREFQQMLANMKRLRGEGGAVPPPLKGKY